MSQVYNIASQKQVIFARARCTMSSMTTMIEISYLPLKSSHVEGLSFSGLDRSWQFPQTTNYESGRSSPHSWQRKAQTSQNWLLLASHMPWPSPDHLKELPGCCNLCQRCGLSGHEQGAHIASAFQHSMQPITNRLRLNPSTSKYVH